LAVEWRQKSAALYERIQHLPIVDRVPPDSLQQPLSTIVGGVFAALKTIAVRFLSDVVLTLYFLLGGKHAFT